MGMFLNSKMPYDSYKAMVTDLYFVDKSDIVCELIPSLGKEARFYCITRPRRFGKSVMANMLAAFFGKAVNASELFDTLLVAQNADYHTHLNRHEVIYIDFSKVPRDCTSYRQYIDRIQNGIHSDLQASYPDVDIDPTDAVWDILTQISQKTGNRFVFIMDEWDAVFHMSFVTEKDKSDYLLFLKSLLKDQAYVELAYMTGVLPISKYSGGSELNMFMEFDMATAERFSEYFGFLDEEVDMLHGQYLKLTPRPKITREDLSNWYDGYHTAYLRSLQHLPLWFQ